MLLRNSDCVEKGQAPIALWPSSVASPAKQRLRDRDIAGMVLGEKRVPFRGTTAPRA